MIYKIPKKEIERAIQKHPKQYLTGNLTKPQDLRHVPNRNIEIGLTKMFAGQIEKMHYHKVQWEFVYVLKGSFMCTDTTRGEKHEFHEGDFFMIESDTPYTQKALTDCLLYFVKFPSIKDKISS